MEYKLFPDVGPRLWVLGHGWTDRNQFADRCLMHIDVQDSVMYPLAPRWLLGNWGHWWHIPEDLAETIERVFVALPATEIILGGNSDFAGNVHRYADECVHAGLPITHIIHYSGAWNGPIVDGVKLVACLGRDDKLRKMRRGTERAADAYGVDVLELAGGHYWEARNNQKIIEATR